MHGETVPHNNDHVVSTDIRTLVIGGAGFIGTHLVSALLGTGRSVTVLDKNDSSFSSLPPEASRVAGDFGEPGLIRKLLLSHEEVIHLAYASVPNTSFENPLADLLENLPPTLQLFAEAAGARRKVLFVSSGGTVYGEAVTLPIREGHPTKPISPYGVTKLTLEHYAHLFGTTQGLHYTCVRPANAFGPGQKPFTGQGFIATALASVLRGDRINIFGQRGTMRDYIYVSDLVEGIVGVLEKGHSGQTYNIGSGVGRSNMDVIEAIGSVMNGSNNAISVEHLPERPFDVKTNVLDTTALREHTGWEPRVDFNDGLARTWSWLREQYG
ncbi:MAG TPA: NAD-dependent epimerase/dehydratase family protein [Deltaproteobacteria bacterium]|nr:NAD-dependent epimerase/dehydratase family protein [Deltaproteobacteria bacterium]